MIRRVVATTLLTYGIALGQTSNPVHHKPLAFEVVSIHPSKTGNQATSWATLPDGYRVSGQSIWQIILMAYYPQGDPYWVTAGRITGMRTWPAWLSQPYAINAKVAQADLAEWQKQGASLDKKPILCEMLQTMLADRCHLIAHRIPGPPVQGFSLVTGRRGAHLTAAKPGETYPRGVPLAGGGVLVPPNIGDKWLLRFYGTTMAELADYLTKNSLGHPVQDHTGLTDRYNFVVSWVDDPGSNRPEGIVSLNDPDVLSHYDIEALGLRRVPIKLAADALVIDHIEKPSEN
ncbi:MAG: TIGR03435 family protein [Acidobacteriaceae bacterium]